MAWSIYPTPPHGDLWLHQKYHKELFFYFSCLKTTQNWAGLEQDDIDNIMIDTTYGLQNTEIEYKNDKLGYGIFFLMMVLEPDSELDCEIHIVSPALRCT